VAPGLAWFELIRTSHFFPSLFACRRISMPIESNDAEDNEEREGDFYSHAHTWSFCWFSPLWHGKFWQTNVTWSQLSDSN
jgi:hypothetical protein